MSAEQQTKLSWLFETNALQISASDNPFWYTSGLIGPYYINTHFLCGGKKSALELLEFIDQEQGNKQTLPAKMEAKLEHDYNNYPIYRQTIDALCLHVRNTLPFSEIDFISGGQRRDWFFAPLVAKKLNKPLLYLYNDLSIIDEKGEDVKNLDGAKVLNVADLLTVGSSYTTKWIPALEKVGAKLRWSLNVVDRLQGGEKILLDAGLSKVESLFAIALPLFDRAVNEGLIDQGQYQLVKGYINDPFNSMRQFLVEHKHFLTSAENSADEKTRARAKLLVDNDLYKLRG